VVAEFARAQRRELDDLLQKIRRSAGDPPRELRDSLEWTVARILESIDPLPGDAR